MAKGGLGRGYETLFSDNTTEVQNVSTLRVAEIEPNRDQPRKTFDDSAIAALADSIREHGMLQPILVRPLENGSYQIVAGERRWRAARMLGLEEVPVTIRAMTDQETMQIALIENLQRENLNPIEEALGYQELMDQFGMTQEGISKIVGRSRSAVANSLRLLQLPEPIQQYLQEGSITVGHAKALAGFTDEEAMLACAARAAEGQLTVRAIEKLAAAPTEHLLKPDRRRDSYYKEMELSLSSSLGRKVKVDQGRKKGVLILEYYDKEDLAALAEKLTH
ncbi:ParB/RepB/Spo0J family partition protein [Ruminococcus sp.]|uniref:ParB/RepB/Spo0J family partition protein n=1 Tax=Ruminococcus sp. TaxID=41978 RepID=UPI0025CC59F9|nr:ParB/RepB/Spo0J family partition protein [Ruminococcus sp.]MCI5816075.1 ParB/RepB/Spo0J family partition protein [Ruminococcus sp.]MDD7556959.1 ParB/RepB/Spo0J family partition protein [Ruminococcus sp.]MDY4963501.1 ParB/RepB/Spo0J family partition protein [Ruminococcus callidus]